jgi:hypothetical protein
MGEMVGWLVGWFCFGLLLSMLAPVSVTGFVQN